jgi:N-acyl-D-amino-acid deacylase
MLEILIKNGEVVDGSGGVRRQADVAIEAGRIVEVGRLEGAQAETVIDASGRVVTPGFVDMHSHADSTLPINPTADSLVHQGITTAVIGQCGSTPVPLLEETREQALAQRGEQSMLLPWEEWSTFGSYLDTLARMGTSINYVPLVGQGRVRSSVMGYVATPPDEEQMRRMQEEVVKAMESGAIGVSTGLLYPPGSYASTEELIEFTRPAGERNGFYFSHIRGDEGKTLLEAGGEAIRIGRESGAAVQISHFKASGEQNWPKSAQALELIDRAREEGLDVSADLYPYLASNTGLSALLPEWAEEGGKEATLKRLQGADSRRQVAAAMEERNWEKVFISKSPKNRSYEGRHIADLAAAEGVDPLEWTLDALIETDLDISMIRFSMSEENKKAELRHPAMMIGTDASGLATEGPLSTGVPHPRGYGTFPRVLGRYVRELGVISLEEAVWKMCGLPAEKLRWSDRGLVRRGYQADLVVLDPETVTDMATFQRPHQYARGIDHVLVNGELVISEGVHTRARPGRRV